MDFSIFRQNLRKLMESKGYNINSFSEEIGIPSATISRYLNGIRTPDITYVIRIANHFKVSVDWMFGLNGDKLEIFPKETQEVIELYSLASNDDRRVIQAVLNKYKRY